MVNYGICLTATLKNNTSQAWDSLQAMNEDIENCSLCSRLVGFREKILIERERNGAEKYWRKPVAGFGDENAKLLVVGLAPAARGANRTGRVFTGDKSSDFLVSCLHQVGLSNQSFSTSRDDGLQYRGMFLTAAVRCVPPENKPTPEEIMNCSRYLRFEIGGLKQLRAILCLGSIAFRSVLRILKIDDRRVSSGFKHGAHLDIERVRVFCSYHPSPRNVNTGILSRQEFMRLLEEVVSFIELR